MNNHSSKKIWFITGISRGLGRALAEAALLRGDTVIGTSRKLTEIRLRANCTFFHWT